MNSCAISEQNIIRFSHTNSFPTKLCVSKEERNLRESPNQNVTSLQRMIHSLILFFRDRLTLIQDNAKQHQLWQNQEEKNKINRRRNAAKALKGRGSKKKKQKTLKNKFLINSPKLSVLTITRLGEINLKINGLNFYSVLTYFGGFCFAVNLGTYF